MLDAAPVDPLRPARFPVLESFLTQALTWGYKLAGKHRHDDFRLERLHGMNIVVTPSVLNPKLTRSGGFFASRIDANLVGRDAEVLDMGTGSGICAVAAAKYARRVVAVDINAAAVRCTRINALLNNVDQKIEARHGDLFEPVAAEQFDLIFFNPPFLRGAPRDDRDRAWRSSDVIERFAAGVSRHLKPGGAALVLLSTFGDAPSFVAELRRQPFRMAVFAQARFINERMAIFKLTHS
jgi:HemK-related putative methylase